MFKAFLKSTLLLLPFSFSACAQKKDVTQSPTFAEMNKKQVQDMSEPCTQPHLQTGMHGYHRPCRSL